MAESPSAIKVRTNVELQPFNTFALPGKAARFVEITSAVDLQGVRERASAPGEPPWRVGNRLVLGGGSNLILTGDFAGWVLKVGVRGRRLVNEDSEAWYVEAGGGENWHDFVLWTLAQGWGGLENLSLIPGTVGAAPIQNIGAYGLEMRERFAYLRAASLDTGQVRQFDPDECAFAYRDSVFKRAEAGRWLILTVCFRLPKRWQAQASYADLAAELQARGIGQPSAAEISEAVIAVRRRKLPDPAEQGNAGSFFKNPWVDDTTLLRLRTGHPALPHYPQPGGGAKLAAGWLIEQCGWKGKRAGAVGCHHRQALVLVNHGGARGAEVAAFAEAIQQDVLQRFGIVLEREPVFI